MSTTLAPGPGPAPAPNALESPARALRGPILLATDGRGPSDAPAALARALAERLDGRVEAVAVLRPLPIYTGGWDLPAVPPEYEAAREAELRDTVLRRLEPVLGSREHWHLEVRAGSPARVITDHARECRAGLVVLGTGSHGVVERLFGEEVSLHVACRASAPVLAVAADARVPMRRAVVGIDFGAASIRAAQTALALLDPAVDAGSVLTLVHVRSPLDETPMLPSWASEYDAITEALFERLRELLAPFVPAGVTVTTRACTGDVVQRMRETAAQIGADLIAVGTHGPGWMDRVLVGSVAANTLRHATTSVLVAPTPRPAERIRLELRVAGQVNLQEPEDWTGALDTLTRRNLGRRARLEVSDPALDGFAVEAERYRFLGATYDPHDRRVEIMLGDPADRSHHLTHGIAHVRALEIVAEDDRRDRALLLSDARGHTALTLLD